MTLNPHQAFQRLAAMLRGRAALDPTRVLGSLAGRDGFTGGLEQPMRILRFIPFLIVPILIYAVVAIPAGQHMDDHLNGQILAITMASGDIWRMSFGGLILTVAILCLFAEVVRSALPTKAAIGENITTAILLIFCVGVFLLVRGFGTNEFFLLTLFLLVDYMTDAVVMIFTSRRSIEVTR